jgi:Zn-dependent protease
VSSPAEEPVEGGRPLLRGRVLGFPVHLDLSFVLIMGVLGYRPGISLRDLILWLLITPVAVLVHELGHAVTARAAGASPQIALAGFGGVTTYVPPGPLSRLRSLGISLAGPAVGLVIGFALLALWYGVGDGLEPGSWQRVALGMGIWTCLGWSVFNLLPIVPLDGGQAMRELLPGAPEVRARRAAMVSFVTALLAAGAAVYLGQTFVALFMGFFALSAVLELRRSSGAARQVTVTADQALMQLLWQGDAARARDVMESLPEGTPVDLAVHGAVMALTGDRAQGHALLDQELRGRPGDPRLVAVLVLTLALEHDWDALVATLQGPLGPLVPRSALERAVHEARGVGREDVAGRLTLLAEPGAPTRPGPHRPEPGAPPDPL